MPLITRTAKGSKLTIQEMDGNLTYLESGSLHAIQNPSIGDSVVWNGTDWVAGSEGLEYSTLIDSEIFKTIGSNPYVVTDLPPIPGFYYSINKVEFITEFKGQSEYNFTTSQLFIFAGHGFTYSATVGGAGLNTMGSSGQKVVQLNSGAGRFSSSSDPILFGVFNTNLTPGTDATSGGKSMLLKIYYTLLPLPVIDL
jgi:hypothetical protein